MSKTRKRSGEESEIRVSRDGTPPLRAVQVGFIEPEARAGGPSKEGPGVVVDSNNPSSVFSKFSTAVVLNVVVVNVAVVVVAVAAAVAGSDEASRNIARRKATDDVNGRQTRCF